ncbi:hypothetical protein F4780DRAFT_101265 [Xylariomycetidae sp. FL0641]|nr:hypothetical protein F4780DRAFT_101265 [Xylariomycetidae sp. FL0641]
MSLRKTAVRNSLRLRRERANKPKPLQISEDGHGKPYLQKLGIVIDAGLTPTRRLFGLDGSEGFFRRSPSPKAWSTESFSSDDSDSPEWDRTSLLALSDSVRASLRGTPRTIGPDSERLSIFLETAVRDEGRRLPSLVDLETIGYARLDKLLEELTSKGGAAFSLTEQVIMSQARSLRKLWRHRFRETYTMLDQRRYTILANGGHLRDVEFNGDVAGQTGKWQTGAKDAISELEGNLQFEPGHWWLNITCAERDGIVRSSKEQSTKGLYGITALPLLTGEEEQIGENTFRYVREGPSSDMHIALISQVGRQIRILRGYRLKSLLAPKAGIRYDGLYTIRQYGCKLDEMRNIYRLELRLERVGNLPRQPSFEEICRIPRPAQLDDWALYEKLEGEKIRARGETDYLVWVLGRQEEKREREEWRCAMLGHASPSTTAADEGE